MSNEFVVGIGPQYTISTNYAVNPDLEVDISGWQTSNALNAEVTRTTTDSYTGGASGRIRFLGVAAGDGAQTVNSSTYRIPVVPGDVIRVSVYRKNVTGTRSFEIRIQFYNSPTSIFPIFTDANSTGAFSNWTQATHTAIAPAGASWVGVLFTSNNTGLFNDVILYDDVFISKNQPLFGAITTVPTQVLTFFDQWSLDRNIDDGCTFSFSLPGNSIPGVQIIELSTDVWLYQQSTLVDRFRVVEVTQTWDEDGRNTMNVQAVCYRRLLASRHVVSDLTFTATSQGDIVWGLIQHTQAQLNGGLGITLNSSGPAVLRDRQYLTGTNILEAITELTQIENGIAWEIDGALELTVTQPSLFSLKPQPVVLGTNALTITRPSGAPQFANTAIVTGDSLATTTEVLTAPSLALDSRGRWEKFRGFPQETDQTNLQESALGLLETSISPSIRWSFEIEPSRYFIDSDYQLGDYLLIKQPDSVVPSGSNPTIPSYTYIGGVVAAQVLTQSIRLTADGALSVSMTAIQVLQRWIDIPTDPVLRWIDVDPTLTWFDLLSELLP